jgi:hypothetical protein
MTNQLTAGPELDARIATEVMGWRFDERWGQIVPPEQKAGPDEMLERCDGGWSAVNGTAVVGLSYNGDLTAIHIPQYSTNIADAWRVLEHLQPPARDDAWVEFVHSWTGALHLSHMKSSEAAFAICRAALQDRENGNA